MPNLDIPNPSNYIKEEKFHSVSAIIEHFEKHPRATNIKNKNFESTFSFKKANPEKVVNNRKSNIRKSCQTTIDVNLSQYIRKTVNETNETIDL